MYLTFSGKPRSDQISKPFNISNLIEKVATTSATINKICFLRYGVKIPKGRTGYLIWLNKMFTSDSSDKGIINQKLATFAGDLFTPIGLSCFPIISVEMWRPRRKPDACAPLPYTN